MNCPDTNTLSQFASGEADNETLSRVEHHLDECLACRDTLDQLLESNPDSRVLGEIGGWSEEQEQLRPTLTALLASSFHVSETLDPAAFSFIDGGTAEKPEGRLGDLVVDGLLGSGAMGAVFRARDEKLERDVAIKVLRPEYGESEEIRRLFLEEARAMAAVHHESVLPIHDVARDDASEPYFVMPLIEGGRLRDRLDRDGRLDPGFAIAIATRIAGALAAVHEAGVLHRDIKPTNVLVDSLDDPDRVWLADFGLSRVDAHGFGEGSLVGTKGYVAPEVEAGKNGTVASDLYSFGAMLHEMLTGRCPDGKVIDDEAIPEWLRSLLGALLSPDPAARPASAAEVAELMEKEAAAEMARIEAARKRERNLTIFRRAALLAGAVLVLLIVADAATGWIRSGAILRGVLGRPISVDGRLMPMSSLAEALDSSDGDLVIRLGADQSFPLEQTISASNRSVHLIGADPETCHIVAKSSGSTGIASVENGSLTLESLSLSYRTGGRSRAETLFTLDSGKLRLDRVSIGRIQPASIHRRFRVITLNGDSSLEIDTAVIISGDGSSGVLANTEPGVVQRIEANGLRFSGRILLLAGSLADDPGAPKGTVELDISQSTLLAASPFRLGRGDRGVRMAVESRDNLWQGSGPFLLGLSGEREQLAESFSLSDAGSLVSGSGGVAAEPGTGPDTPPRLDHQDRDAASLADDWEQFRNLAPDRIGPLEWVDWMVTYRPGTPPVWNEEIERQGKGGLSATGGFETLK